MWQLHCQSLWKSKICLQDCVKVPSSQWSFSFVPDGWFRAYTKTQEIAFSQWLLGDETLNNTLWMVFFKGSLVNVNRWPLAWHVLVEIKASKIVSSIDGLPLNSTRWCLDKGPSFKGMFVNCLQSNGMIASADLIGNSSCVPTKCT